MRNLTYIDCLFPTRAFTCRSVGTSFGGMIGIFTLPSKSSSLGWLHDKNNPFWIKVKIGCKPCHDSVLFQMDSLDMTFAFKYSLSKYKHRFDESIISGGDLKSDMRSYLAAFISRVNINGSLKLCISRYDSFRRILWHAYIRKENNSGFWEKLIKKYKLMDAWTEMTLFKVLRFWCCV